MYIYIYDFPIKTIIHRGFSIAMFDYRRVHHEIACFMQKPAKSLASESSSTAGQKCPCQTCCHPQSDVLAETKGDFNST